MAKLALYPSPTNIHHGSHVRGDILLAHKPFLVAFLVLAMLSVLSNEVKRIALKETDIVRQIIFCHLASSFQIEVVRFFHGSIIEHEFFPYTQT